MLLPYRILGWMFSLPYLAAGTAFAIAAAMAPAGGHAATVFATQTYTLGSTTNTVSNSVVADVFPYFNAGTDSVFGHTYAYPAGVNGSRSSGTNNFAINGYSTYQQVFTNSTGAPRTLNIPFDITGGQVTTRMAIGAAGFQTAGVEANIQLTLNGSPITGFDFKADMTLTSDGAGNSTRTFSLSGPPIGGAPLAATRTGVLSGTYSWNTYSGLLSPVLQAGDTLDFLYTISSYATGSMTALGACTGTGIGGAPPGGNGGVLGDPNRGGGTGNPSCYNDAVGRIGDPFNTAEVPQSVPEPMTAALLGAGLFGLASAPRRRAARSR